MENPVVKALIHDQKVRLIFIDNTRLLDDIFDMHTETNPLLKRILGKTVSAVSLLSGTLKGEQRMSLQLTMSNPSYKVFAETDANGHVRGYLSPSLLQSPVKHDSLPELIGTKGSIRMIKGSAMNQFTGITDMPYGNIVDDISHYFIQSEQTQTLIKTQMTFGENENLQFSQAIFAQLLPGAPHHLLDEVKCTVLPHQTFEHFRDHVTTHDLEKKLTELFDDVNVIGSGSVQFFCGCSKDMLYGMLHTFSKEELKHTLHEKGVVDAVCHICGRTYHFHQDDIRELL